MPARKQTKKQEPLLSTVARKLGHAAGTLSKATQELTQNLAVLPETLTTKLRGAADLEAPAGRQASDSGHRATKQIGKAGRVRKPRIKKASPRRSKRASAKK